MPEAVIVADRPLADRAGHQGLAGRPAAGRPGRARWSGPRWTRSRRSTRTTSTTSSWAAAAGRRVRIQHRPGRRGAARAGHGAGHHRQPLLLLVSLQTTRMAMHAIRAGEGDVFISAGVETVSRFAKGSADGCPDTHNPLFAAGARPAPARLADGGRRLDGSRALTACCPTSTSRWARRPRTWPSSKGVSRADQDEFGVRARTSPSRPSPTASGPRDITPVTPARRHRGRARTTAPGPASPSRACRRLKPVFRPDGTVTAGNCCPLNDGAAAVVIMSDTKAARTRASRRWPASSPPASAGCHRRSWARPGRGVQAGPGPGRPDDRGHRSGRDQRGVRRPGDPVGP